LRIGTKIKDFLILVTPILNNPLNMLCPSIPTTCASSARSLTLVGKRNVDRNKIRMILMKSNLYALIAAQLSLDKRHVTNMERNLLSLSVSFAVLWLSGSAGAPLTFVSPAIKNSVKDNG